MRYPFVFNPNEFVRTIGVLDAIIYIGTIITFVLNVTMPTMVAEFFASALGMLALLTATAFMLIYAKPITGIVAVLLAYRIVQISHMSLPYVAATSSSSQLQSMSRIRTETASIPQFVAPNEQTLEEAMVNKYAPIGVSAPIQYVDTTFKPVSSPGTHCGMTI
jgi:hypothetical protein